jgi:hypothetical protein
MVTELENLRQAASLIEEMTQGRQTFRSGIGGAYITANTSANFKLFMDVNPGDSPDCCRVTFHANPKTTGAGMDCARLSDFLTEANQLYALLLALEMQDFQPSFTEFQQFSAEIERKQQIGPMMGQTF